MASSGVFASSGDMHTLSQNSLKKVLNWWNLEGSLTKLSHDRTKPTKRENSDQPGYLPCLVRVFAEHSEVDFHA